MRTEAAGTRIVDVATCDFAMMPRWGTRDLLQSARPDDWSAYWRSAAARRLLSEIGVRHRYLTQVPGVTPRVDRLTAFDLAVSAVEALRRRRGHELARLDALLFVSTSNPHPCNSQAALLAERLGLRASCIDIKAGCSGGVYGVMHAALLCLAGCRRVLVVMAENLSHLTAPTELRMLASVGDGAACLLIERGTGPGFVAMEHGTAPQHARAMMVATPFPPTSDEVRYHYELSDAVATAGYLRSRWRALSADLLKAADWDEGHRPWWFVHQAHRASFEAWRSHLGATTDRAPAVLPTLGNIGTPSFAVALARRFHRLRRGDRFVLQGVGGGIGWCGIAGIHE